jgi:hypothetical protein
MHFPKHWQLVHRGGVCAWGWSDDSPAAATTDGERRVARICEWLKNDLEGERGPYGYPDRPMREEVLREFRGADGELTAAVSRNSYGCLVLNTAAALFVDVDEPEPSALAGLVRLFRKPPAFEPMVLAKVGEWTTQHPGSGWRVYRTRAGIRLLATDQPFLPEHPICAQAFEHFSADPLYRRLCANQKCFRARLTPKPWRCEVPKPPHRWPWRDAAAEQAFAAWNREYLLAVERHATCRFLGQFGEARLHPALAELVAFHDDATRATSGLPLA